jgi:hypothetical protein
MAGSLRSAAVALMLSHLPGGLRDRLLMSSVGLKPDVFEEAGGAPH